MNTRFFLFFVLPVPALAEVGGNDPGPSQNPPPQPPAITAHAFKVSRTAGGPQNWKKEIGLLEDESFQLQWRTWSTGGEFSASAGWKAYNANGWVVASGNLASAPSSNFDEEVFTVSTAGWSGSSYYDIEVQPKDGGGAALGVPMKQVRLVRGIIDTESMVTQMALMRQQTLAPGMAGAVVPAKGPVLVAANGLRKKNNAAWVTENDYWHLGSDTKAMTATLVGILVDEGVVNWSDSVATLFPEWGAQMKARYYFATFEVLAAHRCGLKDVSQAVANELGRTDISTKQARANAMQLLVQEDLATKSVGEYQYGNINYVIIAAMLERATGDSFENLFFQKLIWPLGMGTFDFGVPGKPPGVTQPYGHHEIDPDPSDGIPGSIWVDENPYLVPAWAPAGAGYCSLQDWAKFLRLHLNGYEGSLSISPCIMKKLHTPYPSDDGISYGWGWGIMSDGSGGVVLGHDGSITTYYARCNVFLHKRCAAIAATNIGGYGTDVFFGRGNEAVGGLQGELNRGARYLASQSEIDLGDPPGVVCDNGEDYPNPKSPFDDFYFEDMEWPILPGPDPVMTRVTEALTPYYSWCERNFTKKQIALGDARPGSDADGDGRPAGLEYLLGSSPLRNSANDGRLRTFVRDGRLYLVALPAELRSDARLTFERFERGVWTKVSSDGSLSRGTASASLPVDEGAGMLRLRVDILHAGR